MNKFITILVLVLFSIIFVSGCGKKELKTGDNISDAVYANEGVFIEKIIDCSNLPDRLSNSVSFVKDNTYSYILECYDSETFLPGYYFLKYDISGNIIDQKSIDIPISVLGVESSNDVLLKDFFSVSYNNFCFDIDGSFYCYAFIYSYSDHYDIDDDLYNNGILARWDSDGNCLSVSSIPEGTLIDYSFSDKTYFSGSDDNNYMLTSSGIALINSDKTYKSKYFDFINSDIGGLFFYSASIIDDDHFSGVYSDFDGNYIVSVFDRKDDTSDVKKTVVMACNGYDYDIKKDVYYFNQENKHIHIAIVDYSDRSNSRNTSEGWYLLKEDVNSGFYPDIIMNFDGYDSIFVSEMSERDLLSNLSDVISTCFDKEEKRFNDKAEQLFYSSKNTYALVPSYYYRTIVGSAGAFGTDDELGFNKFLSTIYPLAAEREVIMNDSRESFLERVLVFNGNKYVDYNNKIADFYTDEFITYLEYAGAIPAELSASGYADIPGYSYGNSMLFDLKWDNIGETQLVSTRFCNGDYIDYGFPCNANEGSGVISATRSFMILSTNAYTNECWSFIKKYLSDDYQNSLIDEIPVTEEGYNTWCEIIGFYVEEDSSLYYYKDGQQYPVEIPDEERIEYILNNINSCKNYLFSDYAVEKIVMEYADEYFKGHMNAREAAEAIDKAVESYLAS